MTERVSDRSADDPAQVLMADEAARRLWGAVRALPAGQRAAIVLYYRDGLDTRSVAEVMGVSTGTVKTLLFRARRRLYEMMSRVDGDEANGGER